MLAKVCAKCKKEKPLGEFHKRKRSKDGHKSRCKICRSEDAKGINPLIPTPINPGFRTCFTCKEEKKVSEFHVSKHHKDGYKPYCKECRKINTARRYVENKDNILKSNKSWREKNPEAILEYNRKRYKENTQYRIAFNLRSRLNKALKNKAKKGSAIKDLGCTIDELIVYLENQFYPRHETDEPMTWENHSHSGWHIDHIHPLSKFNLEDRDQFLKACHYTNLQPLWAEENLAKSNKLPKDEK